MEHYSNYFKFIYKMLIPNCSILKFKSTENFKSVYKKYFNMSHQHLVLQALGMDNYDNAVDLMKQIADEFITEQENEDKLNHEIERSQNTILLVSTQAVYKALHSTV